jgi:hypothetical protein
MSEKKRTKRGRRYRLLVSIVFGLIGFGANFIDVELFEHPHFKVSILGGLLFPLLISQAWGWS